MGAYYIVTDLEVRARFDIAVLDVELRRAGLHGGTSICRGVWQGQYSSSERCCKHPAEALDELLRIVEGLEGEARDLWNRAASRRFDVGFECFDERFASRWQVAAPLLRRLAEADGDLVVTIYRADNPRLT